MVGLIIPFIDNEVITRRCIERAAELATGDWELVLIDNGSAKPFKYDNIPNLPLSVRYIRNKTNEGVLKSFVTGFDNSTADVLCFIHNDVLIHEQGWNRRIDLAFEDDPKLGLAGFFGSKGTGRNGGRIRSMSHMLGQEWGKTDAKPAAIHHGELMMGTAPAGGLDGLAMIFRAEVLDQLITETDMFDDWRAPHHFYDRIMPCKVVDMGWRLAVIGIQFDHWSGATANSSAKWSKLGEKWAKKYKVPFEQNWDHTVYLEAERQFFKEFGSRLSLMVDDNYTYFWNMP